jgi:hypothetical protein
MKTKLLFWLCGGILSVSAPAFALETGQCLPAAEVRAALTAGGQNTIIIGNRSGYGYPTTLAFTSNADGSKGYALRGDKPLGEQASTICIDSVYSDVRLNDITKPGIPDWALMSVDATKAGAICKRDKLGYQEICAPHDAALKSRDVNGLRVMFRAVGTAINPRDNSIRQNQRIVVETSAADQQGGVVAVTPEGADYMLSGYSKASYTQHGMTMMRR